METVAVRRQMRWALDPRWEAVRAEQCYRNWMSRLNPSSRQRYETSLRGFMRWLWTRQQEEAGRISQSSDYHPGLSPEVLEIRTATQLLAYQKKLNSMSLQDEQAEYILLDLMEAHVQEKGGTSVGMINRLSQIRMFFVKNRVKLPPIGDWEPQPTREPTKGTLDVDKVVEIIKHAKLRDQAIFLTMFQSLMDLERFAQFNRKYAGPLVEHIKAERFDEPFRIDYTSGRKRNRLPFSTYIHKDALRAWQQYFEKIRGSYPKPGEPIALDQYHHETSKASVRHSFITVAAQLRIRPKQRSSSDMSLRTGAGPHEAFRDVVRTMLRTRAKKDGFDLDVAEYWMGHRIDKYNYDKFAELDPGYVIKHAKIAARHLNVLSKPPAEEQELKKMSQDNEELRELVKQQAERMSHLEGKFETFSKGKFKSD